MEKESITSLKTQIEFIELTNKMVTNPISIAILNSLKELKANKERQNVNVVNIEDLRNKLGPFKNLITMLENGLINGTIDTHQLVLDEIRVCKQNLDELLK
jgi:hypothetical protein